jgi:hypothetical protein
MPAKVCSAAICLDQGDGFRQRSDEFAGTVEAAGGDYNSGTSCSQSPGDGTANAPAGAGDQGHLVFQ